MPRKTVTELLLLATGKRPSIIDYESSTRCIFVSVDEKSASGERRNGDTLRE